MKLKKYLDGNHFKVKGLVVRVNMEGYELGTHAILERNQYDYFTPDSIARETSIYCNFTIDEHIKEMNGQELAIYHHYDNQVTITRKDGYNMRFPMCLLDVIVNENRVASDIYDGAEIEPLEGVLFEYYVYNAQNDPKRDYIKLSDVKKSRDFDMLFSVCHDCDNYLLNSDDASNVVTTRYNRVCRFCLDNNYSFCEQCEHYYRINDFVGDICYRCDEGTRAVSLRCFGDKIVSPELGEVQSHRTFGVEIECDMNGNNGTIIPKECGIVEDGSVNGDDPYELVTPPLGGKAGEKWLHMLSDSLTNNGVQINKSCGLHVHLIADDFKDKYVKLRNLVLFYNVIEPVIFSMVPYSRRFNHYCRRIKQVIDIEKVKGVYSLEAFEKAFYGIGDKREIERTKRGKYCEKRYAFLNIHNLFFSGKTVEIRNHSGTTQSGKIIPWVNLHALILDYVASAKTVEINRVIKKLNTKSLADKTEMLLSIIGINESHANYLKNRQIKFTPEMNDPFITNKRGASDDDDGMDDCAF